MMSNSSLLVLAARAPSATPMMSADCIAEAPRFIPSSLPAQPQLMTCERSNFNCEEYAWV